MESLDSVVEDICIFAYGFKWSKEHDELSKYIHDILKYYKNELHDITDPIKGLDNELI